MVPRMRVFRPVKHGVTALLLAATMLTPGSPDARAGASGSELLHRIQGLSVVGSVLYVAAHPDDENTRLLAWLSKHRKLRAAYLSLTRGGGGQNLVGTEQAELLGLVRTEELKAARRTDGAMQFFSRARDFGYSKNPEETLKKWGREPVLDDVVRVFRRFRPDVVITRFRPAGRGHGHHTASALLAAEAMTAAPDPKRFADQVAKQGLTVWKPDRLIHNQSHWRLRRMKNPDLTKYIHLDVGGYDPLLGMSYGQIAGMSRSMHKSQGFGAKQQHGPIKEYFEPVSGTKPSKTDMFSGLDFTWARYGKGTATLRKKLAALEKAFDPANPSASLGALMGVRSTLDSLKLPPEGAHWKAIKRAELDAIIVDAAGLWLDAAAKPTTISPGETLPVTLTMLNRSGGRAALRVKAVTLLGGQKADVRAQALKPHVPVTSDVPLTVSAKTTPTTPLWLQSAPKTTMYDLADPATIGDADGPPPLSVVIDLTVAGKPLRVMRPVLHRWVDPVRGELTRHVEVVAPVTVTADKPVLAAPRGAAGQTIKLTLTANGAARRGTVKWTAPAGWRVTPNETALNLEAGQRKVVAITVAASSTAVAGTFGGTLNVWKSSAQPLLERVIIDHPHVPVRSVQRPLATKLVPLTSKVKRGRRLAYIQGSGDVVGASLEQLGYVVDILTAKELASADLKRYHAVIFGVRAFNVHPELHDQHPRWMSYVKAGGTVIAQYNTQNWFHKVKGPVGPWPFQIARGRVTDEFAAVDVANKGAGPHPLVLKPHRLTGDDWSGWVQERGLYFADTWDKRYETPLAMNDPGEKPLKGSVLLARHGKGVFIYTGLSFFRQLPAGVAGAYRLLANMIEHASVTR